MTFMIEFEPLVACAGNVCGGSSMVERGQRCSYCKTGRDVEPRDELVVTSCEHCGTRKAGPVLCCATVRRAAKAERDAANRRRRGR